MHNPAHQYEALAGFIKCLAEVEWPVGESEFLDTTSGLRAKYFAEGCSEDLALRVDSEISEYKEMNCTLLKTKAEIEGIKVSRLNEAYRIYKGLMAGLEVPVSQMEFLSRHNTSTTEAVRVMQNASKGQKERLKELIFESFRGSLVGNDVTTAAGFLMKRGGLRHSWKMRYFSIDGECVTYSKDGEVGSRGEIPLDTVTDVLQGDEGSSFTPPPPVISRLVDKTDFSSEDLSGSTSSANGSLSSVSGYTNSAPPSPGPTFRYPFTVRTQLRDYHLVAPTQRARSLWTIALANACRLPGSVDPELLVG